MIFRIETLDGGHQRPLYCHSIKWHDDTQIYELEDCFVHENVHAAIAKTENRYNFFIGYSCSIPNWFGSSLSYQQIEETSWMTRTEEEAQAMCDQADKDACREITS